MMEKNVNYPQFRKYKNGNAYFKIISKDEWEEITFIGSKSIINNYKASILPDRNYIYDLTFAYHDNWLKIDASEYEKVKANL